MRCALSIPTRLVCGLLAVALQTPVARAEIHPVVIDGFSYDPPELEIRPGDGVQFEASSFHPLRSDDNLFNCSDNCLIVFPDPGAFRFHCFNHGGSGGSGMSGVVRVVDTDAIFANGFEST